MSREKKCGGQRFHRRIVGLNDKAILQTWSYSAFVSTLDPSILKVTEGASRSVLNPPFEETRPPAEALPPTSRCAYVSFWWSANRRWSGYYPGCR